MLPTLCSAALDQWLTPCMQCQPHHFTPTHHLHRCAPAPAPTQHLDHTTLRAQASHTLTTPMPSTQLSITTAPLVAQLNSAPRHTAPLHAPSGPASGTFRGSNNWLSFCGNVNESKLLSSAAAQAKQLLPSGCVTRFPQRSSLTLSHESHHPPSHALHRPCTCMRLHNCATSV